jgi:hypothetical protein
VKIPIVKDNEVVPKGKYEKAEDKLRVCNLVKKKDSSVLSSVSKSKVGVMYEVGSRNVILCERVEELEVENNPKECIVDVLEGSIMQKMKAITFE